MFTPLPHLADPNSLSQKTTPSPVSELRVSSNSLRTMFRSCHPIDGKKSSPLSSTSSKQRRHTNSSIPISFYRKLKIPPLRPRRPTRTVSSFLPPSPRACPLPIKLEKRNQKLPSTPIVVESSAKSSSSVYCSFSSSRRRTSSSKTKGSTRRFRLRNSSSSWPPSTRAIALLASSTRTRTFEWRYGRLDS